jgi:FdhD protein
MMSATAMEKKSILRFEHGSLRPFEDTIISEARLTVFLNGEELAQLQAYPRNLEELVTGFLWSEFFIDSPADLTSLNLVDRTMTAYVETTRTDRRRLSEAVRTITSGCGKGVTFVSRMYEELLTPVGSAGRVSGVAVLGAMRELQNCSDIFRETGGVHSAALANNDTLQCRFDDIGRHNAVDKVLGHVFHHPQILGESPMLLVTGRISSEIVIKAIRGGFPLLVSHSAPTLGALQIAESFGITVIGFARGARFNVYTHPHRVYATDHAQPGS